MISLDKTLSQLSNSYLTINHIIFSKDLNVKVDYYARSMTNNFIDNLVLYKEGNEKNSQAQALAL